MTATTRTLENINGEMLRYVVIENKHGVKKAINIGEKNYEEITKMWKDENENNAEKRTDNVDKPNKKS